MKFYVIFLELPEGFNELNRKLLAFKKALNNHGTVHVIQTVESNYDFLFNSLIEKANKEKKAGEQ